jgi:hypothetical protein
MVYTEGQVGPFNVPCQGNQRITCNLTALITLEVACYDPQGWPAEAVVELYQRLPGGGYSPAPTESGYTWWDGYDEVWTNQGPLCTGTYKLRARALYGPNPQWVWWERDGNQEFAIDPGLYAQMTITVDPGQMGP